MFIYLAAFVWAAVRGVFITAYKIFHCSGQASL